MSCEPDFRKLDLTEVVVSPEAAGIRGQNYKVRFAEVGVTSN